MAWDTHCPVQYVAILSQPFKRNGRISVYHAADLSTFPLRPTCFPRYFLHLCYDWSLCLAQLAPAYWCDFDVVSSGLPPPFPSLRLSPLVASAVSGLRTLFVWFCFFCFCYPTTICFSIYSLHQSSLSDPSPCLYPAGAYCFVWKVRESNPRCA